MSQLIKKEQIEKAKFDTEVIELTAKQVIKDFLQFGMDVSFSGNVYRAYDELFDQLEPHISHLLNTSYQRLMSLLYQIDVGEAKLNRLIDDRPGSSIAEVITEAILERELLKVLTRLYFKHLNSSPDNSEPALE
jgi:hypothetical protein